ncbi:MAG: AMP-binding protein, partial [bacterium]|nr:AMP-binding protein [bacterium]
PVPTNVSGEIYIGGTALARGYLNQAELTPGRFLENPFVPGERIYKTGDLAKRMPDGNVRFLGREDEQVKIRGYRIELGEIENRLLTHGDIKEAVVLAHGDDKGDPYLCAYIIPARGKVAPSGPSAVPGLRDYLSRDLPDYMVPSYFMELERIPLTPNGKVDRGVLPVPDLHARDTYIAPGSVVEKQLVRLWSHVLGVPGPVIGIDSNFFELGGHSLKATILVSKIHKELNVKVSLTEVFRSPTIRELAQYIQGAARERYAAVEPVEKREYYRPSSAQKRLYILYRMEPGSIAYNMPRFIPFQHIPPLEKLQEAFTKLIERHESLRTSFHMIHNQPVQTVHDHVEFRMEFFGKGLPPRSPLNGNRDFARPFDLSRAPLMRVGLEKTGESRTVLMVDMHHIISDGISMDVLEGDFVALVGGKSLSPLRLHYKDYAQWQTGETEMENMKTQSIYWLNEFEGEIPVLQLPADYPRPTVRSFEGDFINSRLSVEESRALSALALETGSTSFMVLLSLTTILLSKVSGQEDIVIGTPVAGRRHADLEKIIGMFVNTLAIRNYPLGRKTVSGFLHEVKELTLNAFENQEYQFEDLVEQLPVERDTGRNPLFDVMFILNNINNGPEAVNTTQMVDQGSHQEFPVENSVNRAAKFDLTIAVVESGESLHIGFQYCTELFKRETIQRLSGYLKRTVTLAVESPGIKLSDIEIISPEEKKQLL